MAASVVTATERPAVELPSRRNVWAVSITSLLTDASTETLTGLLPFYLTQALGAPPSAVGLIEGVGETTASLVKLASGWVSDRWRRRKPLAVFGYGLSTAAKATLLVARSWPLVLASRFLERGGKGVRTAPRDALLADSLSAGSRGLGFGLHRAADTFGAVIGLTAALVVTLAAGAATRMSIGAFRVAVVVSLIPAAAAVLVLALVAREIRPAPTAGEGQSGPLVPRRPRFRWFLAAVVVFTLGNSTDAFLLLRAQTVGMTIPASLGVLILLNVVHAALAAPAGRLSDRVGRRSVLIAAWGIYAAVYLAMALARKPWQVWAILAVYGAYYAANEGVAKAFVGDLVPGPERGRAYGAYHAAIGIAALPASVVAGYLWQALGPGAPFLLGAGLAALATIVLWGLPSGASDPITAAPAAG